MKRFFVLVVCVCLLVCGSVHAFAQEVQVVLNGEAVLFPDTKPCILDGRTMVPMRAVFEALDAGIFWDDETQIIFSVKDGISITLQIDNPLMFVDEKTITLDVAPCLMGERTMVPLRAISESFGLAVEWDEATQTVDIKEKTE